MQRGGGKESISWGEAGRETWGGRWGMGGIERRRRMRGSGHGKGGSGIQLSDGENKREKSSVYIVLEECQNFDYRYMEECNMNS
jgi:hypothetical protein